MRCQYPPLTLWPIQRGIEAACSSSSLVSAGRGPAAQAIQHSAEQSGRATLAPPQVTPQAGSHPLTGSSSERH